MSERVKDEETIRDGSFITFHYRIRLDDGTEVISTYDLQPATLEIGSGQLAANLEHHLKGLKAGDERHCELSPEEAYGTYNPMLTDEIDRNTLPPGTPLVIGEPIHLMSDTGIPYAGLLKKISEKTITVDFNHPLAGRTIFFDATIIGVL